MSNEIAYCFQRRGYRRRVVKRPKVNLILVELRLAALDV